VSFEKKDWLDWDTATSRILFWVLEKGLYPFPSNQEQTGRWILYITTKVRVKVKVRRKNIDVHQRNVGHKEVHIQALPYGDELSYVTYMLQLTLSTA